MPDYGHFGPTSGAPNAIIGVEAFGEGDEQLSTAEAVGVMLAWVGATFAVAGVLFERRDVA
ncbi:MAG: hypothetical protein M3188_00760 [Actinomycetota bacterium]|nr:hypothetical protein [Actinomycetota bacterium]